MNRGLLKELEVRVVRMYVEEHKSAGMIARELGIASRQGIHKMLRRRGVDTRKGFGTRVKVTCDFCNKDIELRRSEWRNRGKKTFCSHKCYCDYFRTTSSYYWRHGCRVGRLELAPVLEEMYGVVPEFVIHHKDGDDRNNDRGNLMAFPGQSDHLKFHRGGIACTLLDGANFNGRG